MANARGGAGRIGAWVGVAAAALGLVGLGLWASSGEVPAVSGAPPASAAPEVDAERLAELQALGYVDWAEIEPGEAARRGVTQDAAEASAPGLLFYHSRSRSRAHLMDGDGELLHTWQGERVPGGWHHVELAPGGELYAIRRDGALVRRGPDSQLRWKRTLSAHHDLALDGEGGLWVLSHALVDRPFEGGRVPVVDDFLLHLDEDGRVERRISLLALLGDAVPRERLRRIAAKPAAHWRDDEKPLHGVVDVLHTNTVERLPRDVPGLGREGDLLVAARELDMVAVVDPEAERVVWRFGPGVLDRPHQPTLTRDGRVLVFDNGPSRGWSRVVAVDPGAREIVWQWAASPREDFYSEKMGGVEELPNGNVLVTESQRGRAFELTPGGELVWEFWNPELRADGRARASIHRLRKLAPDSWRPWWPREGRGEEAG